MEARRKKSARTASRDVQTEDKDSPFPSLSQPSPGSAKKRRIKNLSQGRFPVCSKIPLAEWDWDTLASNSLMQDTPTSKGGTLFTNTVLAKVTTEAPTTINVTDGAIAATLLKPRTAMSLSRLSSGAKTFVFTDNSTRSGALQPLRTASHGTFETVASVFEKRSWISAATPSASNSPKIDLTLLLSTLKAESQSPPGKARKDSFASVLTRPRPRPVTSELPKHSAQRWSRPRATLYRAQPRSTAQKLPRTAKEPKPRISEKQKPHIVCHLVSPQRRSSTDSVNSWRTNGDGEEGLWCLCRD